MQAKRERESERRFWRLRSAVPPAMHAPLALKGAATHGGGAPKRASDKPKTHAAPQPSTTRAPKRASDKTKTHAAAQRSTHPRAHPTGRTVMRTRRGRRPVSGGRSRAQRGTYLGT